MTRLYMLGTDTCAFILRRSSPTRLDHVQAVPAITLAELLCGVQVSSKKKANRAAVDVLVRHLAVIDWTRDAAEHYAGIRAEVKRKGQLIGAHARSLGAVAVTNNVKDFGCVKGLEVESWMV